MAKKIADADILGRPCIVEIMNPVDYGTELDRQVRWGEVVIVIPGWIEPQIVQESILSNVREA